MDAGRLRESFARVAAHGGDAVALHFYSDWFLRHPELRDLFPVSMAVQRDHLIGALVKIVAEADRAEELGPFLAHLGRAHRKFGVRPEHHASLRVSLLATLEHFCGEAWADVAADWDEALGVISGLMCDAAAADEQRSPPWWGQIGFYLMLPVAFSFYARQFIGFKLWRLIHYASFLIYVCVAAHGIFAGTDTTTPGMLGLYALTVLSTYFLIIHRILVSVRHPRRQPG